MSMGWDNGEEAAELFAERHIVKCEYCKVQYTAKELFEEFELTCIPEHWYCSKYCYDNDWEGI